MELQRKEVYFDQYCQSCKHAKLAEDEEPCCECLEYPVNDNSHKPVKYDEGPSTAKTASKTTNKCCKGD